MPLPRAIGRVSRPRAVLHLSVPSPRHFHPTSAAFFDDDDSPDDWMRRMREAKQKKDEEDRKQKAQDDIVARRREAERLAEKEAAARQGISEAWAELRRIQREANEADRQRMQRIADRRIAPVVDRYTELATAIQDWTSEIDAVRANCRARHAEWARKFKELKCQREDAIRALRNTVADIRHAISGECQWLDQECRRLNKEKGVLKDEFEDILNEIKAATISEQLARAQRAEARKTIADWKQVSYGFLTFVWSTSAALAAAANEFEKGLKQSERHLTRLEQASSIIQHASSLHCPPTVRQRLVFVDDQYGHLIPDVDRLICQPRRQMQISWEAENERFNNAATELSKLAHDLNQIIEKSRYLGFNTTEGSLRLHTFYIYQTLTKETIDTHELIKDLLRSWEKRARNSAFQMQKEKARAAADVYRTCEKLSARMKHLFFYMRPDFNGLTHRYTLIRNLETDDLCGMRVDRIMSLIEEASRQITSSNQLFSEYETFSRKQGYQFAPSHLAGSRRHLMAAIQAYSAYWRSIRFLDVDDLHNVVSRRSEELAKSGELEYVRKHLVQYTEARLRRLWESPSYFEIYNPALMPPLVLRSFMEMWPEKYLDAGMNLLPGFIKNVLQSMKEASPGRKEQLARIHSLYEKVLRWAKGLVSDTTRKKVPGWLEKVSQEAPPLYILDKSAAAKIARVSGSRDAYFSYNLYRPAPGLKRKRLRYRPSCYYHDNAASDADIVKALRGKFIGFDMRWNQNAAPKDGPHANASLIMLARESRIDIFHLARYPTRDGQAAIAEEMVTILESPTVIKVCVDAREKCDRLRDYLGVNPQGFLDLGDMHYGLQELQLDRPVPRRPLSLNDLTAEHLKYPMHDSVFDNTLDFTQPLLEQTQRSMGQSVYACVALWHAMSKKRQARQLAARMMPTCPLNEDLTRATCSIDAKDTGNDHSSNVAQEFFREDPSSDAEYTRAAERNGKEEVAGPAEKDMTSSSSSRIRSKVRRTASTATGTRGDFWAQQESISRPHQRRDTRRIPDAAPEDDDVEGFYRSTVKAAENRGEAGESTELDTQGAGDDGSISNPIAEAASPKPSYPFSSTILGPPSHSPPPPPPPPPPSSSSSPALTLASASAAAHHSLSPNTIAAAHAWADGWIAAKPSTATSDSSGGSPERRRLRLMLYRLWQHDGLAAAELTRAVDGATTEMVEEDILSAVQWEERLAVDGGRLERLLARVPAWRRMERFLSLARRVGMGDEREVAFKSVRLEKGDEGGEGTSDKMVVRGVAGRKRFARTTAVEGKKERRGVKDKREKMTAVEFMRYMSKSGQGKDG